MDIQSVSLALASIKTATDIARIFKDTDVTFEKAEAKLKLAELISALADTKIQIAEIQQTIIEKDEELRTLKEKLDIKGKIHWERPYYWLVDDGKKDGPYCQRCCDKDKELIRLYNHGNGHWQCNVCKSSYFDSDYRTADSVIKDYNPFDNI